MSFEIIMELTKVVIECHLAPWLAAISFGSQLGALEVLAATAVTANSDCEEAVVDLTVSIQQRTSGDSMQRRCDAGEWRLSCQPHAMQRLALAR